MSRRIRWGAAIVVSVGAGVALGLPPAGAAGARVTLSALSSRVDAGAPITFEVSAPGTSHRLGIALERQFGPRHEWRPVARVRAGASLQVSTAGLGMGRYVYRAVVMDGSRAVARSGLVTVFSYGKVSLPELARRSQETHVGNWGTGSIPVGGSPFTWQSNETGNDGPGQAASITAQNSSCRSIDLQFAVSDVAVQHGGVGQVGAELTQTSSAPQNSNGSAGLVNAANFTIDSPSWQVDLWASYGVEVYFTGTLSCWSPTGDA